ncbi:MAG TPA: phasin family protein [Roseiarcus sp.]|nr:phasin family protein [Roseiarcus sp.]
MTEETENTSTVGQAVIAPAAARDFVKKAAGAAMERATSLHANAENATASVEQKLVESINEVARLVRQSQQAAFEDAEAFLSGVDKLASAKTVGEAMQIYVDYLRGRGDAATFRARAVSDYFSKLMANGAKTVGETVSNVGVFSRKAA